MERKLIFSATKKDFKVDWFSGTGAGGQHRNKHQNCCRITHVPSGLTETGQSHRERTRNLRDAFGRLVTRLVEHYVQQDDRERYGSSERVRTYHEPRQTVLDHASGERRSYDGVVDGKEFGELIDARRLAKGTADEG